MNIAELRDILRDLPGDMKILLSSDAEGNEFHLLHSCGDQYIWDPDTYTMYNAGEETPEWSYPVLVLWPDD